MAEDGTAVLRAIAARRSVRRFTDDPVTDAQLDRLLAAANDAPSAGNRQAWTFVVVTDAARKAAMAAAVTAAWGRTATALGDSAVAGALQAYGRNLDWFARAPVVVAIAAKAPESFLVEALGTRAEAVAGNACSAAMAAENLLLAAAATGLGACALTGAVVAEDDLRPLLGLGRRQRLVCLVALGHPAEHPAPPPRRDHGACTRRPR